MSNAYGAGRTYENGVFRQLVCSRCGDTGPQVWLLVESVRPNDPELGWCCECRLGIRPLIEARRAARDPLGAAVIEALKKQREHL